MIIKDIKFFLIVLTTQEIINLELNNYTTNKETFLKRIKEGGEKITITTNSKCTKIFKISAQTLYQIYRRRHGKNLAGILCAMSTLNLVQRES